VNNITGETLTFIRTNGCSITRQVGVVSLLTMIIVSLAIYILSKAGNRKEHVLDHSQQTTKDYSLQVRNPPKDAKDPEEWRAFFSQFGTVVSVTVVMDNQELLLKLLKRRQLITQLEDIMPPYVKVDPFNLNDAFEHALPLSRFSKMLGTLDGPFIQQTIQEIDHVVKNDLSLRSYDVSEVFVSFDNEADQQNALEKMQVPLIQVHRRNVNAYEKSSYAFRGTEVLNTADPPETSNVIWYHLNDTISDFWRQRIVTFFVTVICIFLGCAFVVYIKYYYGTVYGALAVSGEHF
jgi:Cytosolic domain of 10TM putative phosphate transporter